MGSAMQTVDAVGGPMRAKKRREKGALKQTLGTNHIHGDQRTSIQWGQGTGTEGSAGSRKAAGEARARTQVAHGQGRGAGGSWDSLHGCH